MLTIASGLRKETGSGGVKCCVVCWGEKGKGGVGKRERNGLDDAHLPFPMLAKQIRDLNLDVLDIPLRLLDRCPPIALALPALDVLHHLADPSLLLVGLLAQLAVVGAVVGMVYQLEPAGLPGPILLVALLPEVPPLPVPADPASLLEVTHGDVVIEAKKEDGREGERNSSRAGAYGCGEGARGRLAWSRNK